MDFSTAHAERKVKESALQADLRAYTAAIASCKAAGAWQVAARLQEGGLEI